MSHTEFNKKILLIKNIKTKIANLKIHLTEILILKKFQLIKVIHHI